MSKKRKKTLNEKLRHSQEENQKLEIEGSKLKQGDDYRGKIVQDGQRFQEKIIEKQSKRVIQETEKGGERRGKRHKDETAEPEIFSTQEARRSSSEIRYKNQSAETDSKVNTAESVFLLKNQPKEKVTKSGRQKLSLTDQKEKQKKQTKVYKETHKRRNYSNQNYTRTKPEDIKQRKVKETASKSRKKQTLENIKKSTGQDQIKAGLMVGAERSQEALRAYLSSGSEDNVGVEGAEKLASANSKLIHQQKTSWQKRKNKETYQLKHTESKLQEKKSKLEFCDEVDKLKSSSDYQKSSHYKKFQKRRQMKQTIQQKNKTRLRDRIAKSFKEVATSAKNFIVRRFRGILIALGAVVILGTFLINFGGSGVSVLMNTANSTLTTTYLSSEQVLNDINNYFSALEDELRDELGSIEETHPGYDEYIVNQGEYVGHNIHELLSYITSRYGEVKNVSDVSPILDQLFDDMYEVEYQPLVEIRYRTVTETYIDEDGNEQTETYEEAYEYKKLIVTLHKREMDSIIREVFANYPDNLAHYEALFQAQGNMRLAFANSDLIDWNGGVGGGQEYEASGSTQKRIVDAAYITPSPGAGWCAMWVSQVYQNAGLGYLGGNADDMYRNFTYTNDRTKLQVGMLVAVESSSSGGALGLRYGHVGIYIGDGMVMDNIGTVRVTTLDNWIAIFCKHSPVGYGFPPNVQR